MPEDEQTSAAAMCALGLSLQSTQALLRHRLLSPEECEASADALDELADTLDQYVPLHGVRRDQLNLARKRADRLREWSREHATKQG